MARAHLKWSLLDLSERTGLRSATISAFENDDGQAERRTIEKIATALALGGIVFNDDGGVSPAHQFVTVLEGEDSNERLLEDIYQTLKSAGGEVLIAGLAEADPDSTQGKFVGEHIARLQAAGITERILLNGGDRNMIAPRDWYRWMPSGDFMGRPFQAYAGKVALIDFGREVIVIDHPQFAHNYRAMFDVIWHHAALVPEGGDV